MSVRERVKTHDASAQRPKRDSLKVLSGEDTSTEDAYLNDGGHDLLPGRAADSVSVSQTELFAWRQHLNCGKGSLAARLFGSGPRATP